MRQMAFRMSDLLNAQAASNTSQNAEAISRVLNSPVICMMNYGSDAYGHNYSLNVLETSGIHRGINYRLPGTLLLLLRGRDQLPLDAAQGRGVLMMVLWGQRRILVCGNLISA